ncbi:hypothetical protein M231_00472 [Tremella mesenterica]|uniref:Amino acid permease/ SLC12A domain-containing protein n=1 Tax=Tremella mesenterica TaxID=5217 RepID=A0A4Q1BVG3_TREME|nr:hypothetical protein M231_00472 [Tremella mesenterica]
MNDMISPVPSDDDTNGKKEKEFKSDEGSQEVDKEVMVLPVEQGEDNKIDVHTHLYDGLQRNMEQRHLQMIALAGTVGVGFFLGSGKAIAHGGPVGALLAYMLIGSVSYCLLMSVGEMAVYAPISGGFIHLVERFFNPSVGFAMGWQTVYSGIITVPNEIISASILMSFWDDAFPVGRQALYLTLLAICCASVNFLGVRWFGESEFIFACIKIALIVGLILGGLIVDLGGSPSGDRIGFRYWRNPGAFAEYHYAGNLGKFLGWSTDLLQAAFSFLGMEQIAVAAAEVKNPRVSVAKAFRRIFYRICLFYVIGIFIVGMLVPYNNPKLLQSTGTAASSPFVLAFNLAGIKVLPSIINAAVLTSAFSAGSSALYLTSRMLYGLGLRGHAPKIFAKTTKKGLPIVALMTVTLFTSLSFMQLGAGGETALNWLSNLSSLSGFINWCTLSITFLRFKAGCEAQGIDRTKFHFWNRYQPWPAYWVIFWCIIVIVFNGWEVFTKGGWNTSNFIVSYINLPIFFLLILGYWFIKRPRHLHSAELDFVSNIPTDAEVSYEEPPPKNLFYKVCNYLFT